MKLKKLFSTAIIGLVVAFVCASTANATLVKSLNIKQLTGLAHQIVRAKVVNKQIEADPYESGALVCYYTLAVEETLKAPLAGPSDEIIIKQLADGTTTQNGLAVRQQYNFPQYEVGKTYVFFLPQAHSKTGLSAPIGLAQGVFEIVADRAGRETVPAFVARAGILKKGLTDDAQGKLLKAQVEKVANDARYEEFKKMIQ